MAKIDNATQGIALQSPNISAIGRAIGAESLRDILILAITEVAGFFNVGKTMNDAQVALTAELIADRFWYLKVEEIKYVFRRAMKSGKVYDRIDGNVLMQWLGEYDLERDNVCESETYRENKSDNNGAPISDTVYREMLKARAENGDEDAKLTLARYAGIDRQRTSEEQEQWDRKFREIKLKRLIETNKI